MSTAVARSTQVELAFSDPLEPRVLPRSGWPFWTLNTRCPGERMVQHPYRLSDMEFILGHLSPNIDTYMSQAFFARPCRQALHLTWLTHGYVDIDLYKVQPAKDPRQTAVWLRTFCDDEGIPAPSVVIFSGRGLYAKWAWSSPLPRAAAGRAVAVSKALVRRFAAFGADPAAVDVSRILRVVGTTNTKSGERTEILWLNEQDGAIQTHDFELFADEILPYTAAEIRGFRDAAKARQADVHLLSQERAKRTPRPGSRRAFVPEDWHWGVLEDIRTLIECRWVGVVPVGYRDTIGHVGACQLAMVIPAGRLWYEIQAWARIVLPADYANSAAFRRHCSTLLDNAQRAAQGEKVEFDGLLRSPVYTYRKETLIERLEISVDEMPLMTRLIDTAEKTRRRRAQGVVERSKYVAIAKAAVRRGQVAGMRERGLTFRAIAAQLKISLSEVHRLAEPCVRSPSTSTAA